MRVYLKPRNYQMAKLSQEEVQLQSQGRQLKEMSQSQGWAEVLEPWLRNKISHSWVDPRSFKSQDDFVRAYNVSWGFAQSAQEILSFVENMVEQSEGLTKKEKDEVIDKLRESIS